MMIILECTESLIVIHVKQCRSLMEKSSSPTSFMSLTCSFIHKILITSHVKILFLLKSRLHKVLSEDMEGWALTV